jgi:hypothetical protein
MIRPICLLLSTLLASAALAADVGVSINVGQPGFYGQINIGNVPQPPAVIYAQPTYVQPVPVGVVVQPLYLRVPPGHEKHWAKHCAEYNACGRPVYFVREDWYQEHYRDHHEHEHDRDDDRGHGRGHGHDRDDDDHDHGHGHGHGHDRDD